MNSTHQAIPLLALTLQPSKPIFISFRFLYKSKCMIPKNNVDWFKSYQSAIVGHCWSRFTIFQFLLLRFLFIRNISLILFKIDSNQYQQRMFYSAKNDLSQLPNFILLFCQILPRCHCSSSCIRHYKLHLVFKCAKMAWRPEEICRS